MLLANVGHVLPLCSELDADRPLGAALVCCLDGRVLDGLAVAFHEHRHSPWCPLVLATHAAVHEETLDDLRPDTCRISTILLDHDRATPTFDEVRAALAQHGPPTPTDMVGYIGLRTDEGLARTVSEALEGPSSRTSALRRRLAGLGVPSPLHWLNLFQLTTYLSVAEHPCRKTLEQVALAFNKAPRTLSAWCANYLQCTWPEARRRLGWEWMVETMLREVPPPPPRKQNRPNAGTSSYKSPEPTRRSMAGR
jgi:hypothetical protein